MGDAQEAIQRVVDAFERSDWSEIDVRYRDLRVHLAVGTAGEPASTASSASTAPDAANLPPDAAGQIESGASSDSPSTESTPHPDAHVVVSPSPGILWRSPEPGAPHFADVGDVLDESATVCIVEVMKLMNHVKAGVSGEVVAVHVANGVAVEMGQPLFAIAPAGSPP